MSLYIPTLNFKIQDTQQYVVKRPYLSCVTDTQTQNQTDTYMHTQTLKHIRAYIHTLVQSAKQWQTCMQRDVLDAERRLLRCG